jgi:hypothetical protein
MSMNVVVMEVREDDEDAETKIVGAASPTMTRCTINDNTAANSGEMLAVDLGMVASGERGASTVLEGFHSADDRIVVQISLNNDNILEVVLVLLILMKMKDMDMARAKRFARQRLGPLFFNRFGICSECRSVTARVLH